MRCGRKGRCQEPLWIPSSVNRAWWCPFLRWVIDNKLKVLAPPHPTPNSHPSLSSSCQWPGLCPQHQTQATQFSSTSPFLLTILLGLNVHNKKRNSKMPWEGEGAVEVRPSGFQLLVPTGWVLGKDSLSCPHPQNPALGGCAALLTGPS